MNRRLRVQFLIVSLVVVALGAIVSYSDSIFGERSESVGRRLSGWWIVGLATLPFLVWFAFFVADFFSWLGRFGTRSIEKSGSDTDRN